MPPPFPTKNPRHRLRQSERFPYHRRVAQRGQAAILLARRGLMENLRDMPTLLLQAVIVPGSASSEGQLIEAVTLPWFEIVKLLDRSPEIAHQIDWRKWEEIIAGAYAAQGCEVILTPRSNDRGRDVVATWKGLGSVRFLEQVKAFGPGQRVTANDVRAMVGVLELEGNVSKGIVSTTAEFAPGIECDAGIARLMPYRLELRARDALIRWLRATAGEKR